MNNDLADLLAETREGVSIRSAGGWVFIPAPVPPVEPTYEEITDWWGESAAHHRNLAKGYEYSVALEAYEAQMDYYNSVIVPLGNNH